MTVLGTRGRLRVSRRALWAKSTRTARCAGPARIACDLVLMSGGYTPSVHCSRSRAASSSGTRRCRPSSPARRPSASARPAPAAASTRLAAALDRRRGRGRSPAAAGLRRCRNRDVDTHGRSATPCSAALPARCPAADPPASQGLRRLAERCDGARSCARDARGLPLDRAHQALHHDRHGDRSGQDLEPERARHRRGKRSDKPIPEVGLTTFRMPYTPVTFGSSPAVARGDLFDPGAHDADARLGGGAGRGVRGCRPVEARALLPARRRGHAARGRARMPGGAQCTAASSMPRRWARSRSSAPMPPSS